VAGGETNFLCRNAKSTHCIGIAFAKVQQKIRRFVHEVVEFLKMFHITLISFWVLL